MIKWKRPSGTTIETNEAPANIAAAEALGWERVEKKMTAAQKKAADKKAAKDKEDEDARIMADLEKEEAENKGD